MKFGPLQLQLFQADEGAYSIVTENEREKGQITLTEKDGEADIATRAIGTAKIPRTAAKEFPLQVYVRQTNGNEQASALTINYPKSKGYELRIYRKASEGFDFEAGDVWFIYRRKSRLVVGAIQEQIWRNLGRQDDEDQIYVDLASGESPEEPKTVQNLVYTRDPKLARRRFALANYRCEFDSAHQLFTGRVLGKPFLEAHHLVPMKYQEYFKNAELDHIDNIYALCPFCHRAVHHAEPEFAGLILKTLVTQRDQVCDLLGVNENKILQYYSCEQIIRGD